MKLFEKWNNKLGTMRQKFQKDRDKAKENGSLSKVIWSWVFKLRSVFLAIPVVFASIIMAINNSVRLPDAVSLCMPSFSGGTMAIEIVEISKSLAIFGPLLITAACLVLMFCSRRVAYPWLISIFSLVLPLFVYFASVFPG